MKSYLKPQILNLDLEEKLIQLQGTAVPPTTAPPTTEPPVEENTLEAQGVIPTACQVGQGAMTRWLLSVTELVDDQHVDVIVVPEGGTEYDPQIYIDPGAIACANDTGDGQTESLTFTANSTGAYYVYVFANDSPFGGSGAYTLTIESPNSFSLVSDGTISPCWGSPIPDCSS